MRIRDLANPLSFFRNHRTLPDIPSSNTLRRILERERARTDRTGQEFSLVVFDPGGRDARDTAGMRRLADLLARRIRATDALGLFDEKSLGVVLPATPAEGAWKFANDVCLEIPAAGLPPRCTVYTYPTAWASSEPPPDAPPPPRGPEGGKRAAPSGAGSPGGKGGGAMAVNRMERIFGCPLPAWKRVLDILGALAGLVLFSPLFLILSALIKVVSPGPAFFKQERVGHMGDTFTLWKFRTMHLENDAAAHRRYLGELIRGEKPMEKLDAARDPRIIPFGKLLRRTCLDELPQLFNVLRGDMSLVGPRPCLPYEAEEYLSWHARRFDSAPGMTGLWQVSGKNRTTFKEMVRFDIAYSRRVSPWTDFKILAKTAPAICVEIVDHFTKKRPGGREASGAEG
jgi:lipopolysaccharide/colanic/teichoic acid biosynthesis glycosyltransferase